jgi:hypothetical protein
MKINDDNSLLMRLSEAEVVKRMFQMSLEGIGTRTISETLNNEGV